MLKEITDYAVRANALAEEIETLETRIKVQKLALKIILEERLPELMDAEGVSRFETGDLKVEVKTAVLGGLPKDAEKRAEAVAWLEKAGAGDLFRSEILIPFAKSQHNVAVILAANIRDQGFDCDISSNVHPQTLLKWARERLESGESFEPETLGLFVQRKADVKLKPT